MKYYPCDEDTLIVSAYLHDITKETDPETQIKLCAEEGITLDNDTLRSVKTMHAFSSPAYIKKYLPEYYTDEVAKTVAAHTTGDENMTVEQKLLFLSDVIEPTRTFDDCRALRERFYSAKEMTERHLDETILDYLRLTIKELAEKSRYLHTKTVKAYNFLMTRTEIGK